MTGAGFLFPPVDERLGIPARGASPGLLRKVCAANLAGSFQKAARVLEELAGIRMSVKEVQLLSEKVGQVLVQQREDKCQAYLKGAPVKAPLNPPELLVISADGGRVQTRDPDPQKRWKENKVGVVYRAYPRRERPGQDYTGPPPIVQTHVATMHDWETMGDYLSQEAAQRGYEQARQKILIGDAAQGIQSLWQRCFGDAEFIIDWAHAAEHLHACSVAAFADTRKAQEWYERNEQALWEGRIGRVIRALQKLSRRLGKPRKNSPENDPRRTASRNIRYFRDHQAHMDYPRYRRNGWPIGSGVVESTVKRLGLRVKGSEKQWSIPGVEAILTLMTTMICEDNRWEIFWQTHSFAKRPDKLAA